jgi:hypothetical protein
MRLYHYLESKHALDDIRRRRLKVSRIDDMNDPYEWNVVYSDDEESQLALERTQRTAVEKYGVLCFSRSWNNILMWSHYGDKHKGICLGFDVLDEFTGAIEYVEDVLVVGDIMQRDASTGESRREEYKGIIDRSSWAKYRGWRYEEEVRMHGERRQMDEETGMYFVNFDERLKLREVIAGARFPMSKKPIEDALKGYSEDVKIVKAGRSPRRFEIIVDEKGFDEANSMNDSVRHDPGSELRTTPATRRRPRIPFTWERTTVPEMPYSLPIGVELNITADSIRVHAKRDSKGTIGEMLSVGTDVDDARIQFPKDMIVGIEIFLMPDVPDEADWAWVRENDLSWVYIRHRDPNGVEDYFESLFTSAKAYWPKALAKLLRERAGIEPKVTQETRQTREARLIAIRQTGR